MSTLIKKPSVFVAANKIAKKDFTVSTYWNKIQKELPIVEKNDTDYIRLAFEELKNGNDSKDRKRTFESLLSVPYVVLINHFLPKYNDGKKFDVKIERLSWYTFSLFLSYMTKLSSEDYNGILNFGLQYKPQVIDVVNVAKTKTTVKAKTTATA